MANRKVLIESILGLAQKLGANPNKFMGTKSNINFLGTGDKGMKGTTFSGQLNEDFLNLGFGKDDMIKIIEQDAGYVTAGKLNDSQLNTMFNNLKMIDETFSPPPGPMNVIDLETGTVGLNKQGLESLRETDKIKRFTQGLTTGNRAMSRKIKEGIESLKTKFRGSDAAKAEDDFIRTGAADFGDSVAAEGGRRAVVRQVMKNNSNYFGLTPEVAESIAKSKDLGKGGSQFADPLIVFRDKGNFTRQELEQIDAIIEANPFDDVKNIADKVSDYLQSIRPDGFAEGGRIGFKSGKTVKGIAELLKLGNKKFGKGTLKTADEVDSSAFYKSPLRSKKQMTDDEIQAFADEFGVDPREEYYDFDGTFASANKIFKDEEAYKAEMYDQYITGKLDPVAGDNTPARMKFLQRNADEARDTGDTRLFNRNDADELDNLESQFGSVNTGGIRNAEVPVEMMTEDLLLVKYPGISERLAKQIGNDKDLQRKAEAIAEIERALALQESGKSVDETISILNREPKTKMKKGGLAQILEM